MPVALVDRLPLPNLKAYTAVSVLLMSVALFHAVSVTNDPEWKVQTAEREVVAPEADSDVLTVVQPVNVPEIDISSNRTRNFTEQFSDVVTFMLQEPLCMWSIINMSYCLLALAGCGAARLALGRVRAAEAQRARDKLWNFAFYKFIFVFGVLGVQYADEVLAWGAWFALIGGLQILAQLAGDRFEYVSMSSTSGLGGWSTRLRLLALLAGVLAACGALLAAALRPGLPRGPAVCAFMLAECVLVALSALHVAARLALQALDADAGGPLAYYTHLVFEAGALMVEVAHVVHMVVHSNMVVSMASLVLLMQLRHLLHALQLRLRRHRQYAALAQHMARSYPMASKEEVEKNQDNCAICWEPMKEARKLPCSHLFHNSCLYQWVQQDASCPTCRRTLKAPAPLPSGPPSPSAAPSATPTPATTPTPAPDAVAVPAFPSVALPPAGEGAPGPARRQNHLFHFDGSRYVSWLPSFSLEVTRVRAPPPHPHHLDAMVRQVQAVFPQYSARVLAAALAASRSAATTADDILAGRLLPPEPEEAEVEAPPTEPPAFVAPQLDEDEDSGEEPSGFSEEAAEREASLRRRRARLLAAARRRLLQRDT